MDDGKAFADVEQDNPEDEDLPFLRCFFLIDSRKKILDKLMWTFTASANAGAGDDARAEDDKPNQDHSQKVDEVVKETKKLLSEDEYLLENAMDARPLCIFARPEILLATCTTKDAMDNVMKEATNALNGCKTVAKALKRSCDDFRKLRKSLDKARQQFEAKKQAAEKVSASAGSGQAAGRTSWAKMLTQEDFPIVQAGRSLLTTRPLQIYTSKDLQSDVALGLGSPAIIRKGNLAQLSNRWLQLYS